MVASLSYNDDTILDKECLRHIHFTGCSKEIDACIGCYVSLKWHHANDSSGLALLLNLR